MTSMVTESGIITIDESLCGECGGCVSVCPTNAIFLSKVLLEIDKDTCILCGICVIVCPVGALAMRANA